MPEYATSALLPRERRLLNGLLLAEQQLGKRKFHALLGGWQKRIRASAASRLAAVPAGEPREVERRENLTPEEFQRDYFRKGRPVIFSGAAREWGCVQHWSLDYFASGHGDKDVLLVEVPGLTGPREQRGFEFLTLQELVRNIRGGGGKYLRFSPLLHDNPDLVKAFDLSWFERMRGGKTFAQTYYMFLGGKGDRTHLHNDQPCNLYVQVRGQKRWTLFDCADSALLYPEPLNTAYVRSQVSLSQPDPARHPLFRHARARTAVLQEGDILYVPPFTWHEVENLSETVAFGYRYSSLRAALGASLSFSLLRILSTNPPIWKTAEYGKTDTNLIWAHSFGMIREVLAEQKRRRAAAPPEPREARPQ